MSTKSWNKTLDQALSLHRGGKTVEAEKLCKAIIDEDPQQPDALHCLGVMRMQADRSGEAASLFRQALAARPDHVDTIVNLSYALLKMGRPDDALHEIRKASAEREPVTALQLTMANILLAVGRVDEAIECARQVLKKRPDLVAVRSNVANLLHRSGRFEEAIHHYERLLEYSPQNVDGQYRLGVVFQDLGEKDKALTAYRKAASIDPGFVKAWFGIAAVSNGAFEEEEVAALLARQQAAGTSSDDRMRLAFALGRHFENSARHSDAAEQYLLGNALHRTGLDYDIRNDLRAMENLSAFFDKAFFDKWQDAGLNDETPIFIVGMPRSGTTLVEQILASHSQVFAAGEISVLIKAILARFPIRNGVDYTSSVAGATKADIQAVARLYRDGLPVVEASRITDKLPHNFLNVGMIRVLFPRARIIHCRRDPRDTCFSIFKQLFGSDAHQYAYDLEELALYYKAYSSLMDHWERVMPGHIHTIRYEALIDKHDQTIRELLDACSLGWEPACLEFHKLERPIATLSASQVRQPVYGTSVGAWRRYEKMLQPLLRIIEE